MIIPWLRGFKDLSQAPITWMLFFLNIILFVFCLQSAEPQSHQKLDRRFLQKTGVYYLQTQNQTELPQAVELFLWGGKALRDPVFLSQLDEFSFQGDASDIQAWKNDLRAFKNSMENKLTYQFGVRRSGNEALKYPLTWVTYQFMHADFFHLVGNMVFLLIFGVAIESLLGAGYLLQTYVLGGVAGAVFSGLVDSGSALPMVGASASISALIGLYILIETKKRISYLYFLSPFPGFYGEVFLSKWWLVPLCLLPDLANWLTDKYFTESELIPSSVATSAHLGGVLWGFIVAAWVLGHVEMRRQSSDIG